MKLFAIMGNGPHGHNFDDGMRLVYIVEKPFEDIEIWNQKRCKELEGATPVSMERFINSSDDCVKMQIRRFVSTDYLRRIEMYVLAKDEDEAFDFVSELFDKCWSRW